MARASDDRAALLREIRAHLEWERDLGAIGVPRVARVAPAAQPGAPHESRQMVQAPAIEKAETPSAQSVTVPAQPVPPQAPPVQLPAGQAPGAVPASPVAPAVPAPATPAARAGATEVLQRLSVLEAEVRSCTRCELAKGRTKSVFARGNPASPLVFVGEGPGQEEDLQGLPFVGAAGQLLDKMIAAMGFARDDVYICNVVKCRPPGNRTPLPTEAQACSSYLHGQLDAVAPRVIVALGRCAAENMGLVPEGGGWRGRWGQFRGVDVMPTYHPAFLLRSPEFKRPVWEDLQKVMARLRGTG